MANMVTRTIITTKCTLMCVDTEKGEVFNSEVIVPRAWRDDVKLLKRVKELYGEDATHKVVSIVSKEEIGTLYGMLEEDFIKNAKVLPARDAKEAEKTESKEEN